ncbi:MAG: hypothetical protein IPP66_13135 [Anaerolineales bacterium]|nr:hypothetical protein [Anaerolineales bacterium]
MLDRFGRIVDFIIISIIILIIGGSDTPRFAEATDRVRFYTREIEFDYPNWVWNATWTKIEQATINSPYTFDRETNKQLVSVYLHTTENLMQTENRIEQVYADPNITDKETATSFLREQRDELIKRQKDLAPFAESILQEQLSEALAGLGLTTIGQPLPPVLYHNSPTPLALIVSPRNKIEQTANISVLPTLTIDDQIKLEDKVSKSLDVSTLVVPIGGVGVYPTMVMETADLNWLISTIAHEWTHNYLELRPLGLNYSTTPELRTMNETTANIVGDEVGKLVVQAYYPELLASSFNRNLILFNNSSLPSSLYDDPPPFDFRAEMHETRVTADQLLSEGKIEEAETYMEGRRQIFWQNGYLLRKLNQAYFAFHGAYADVPGGAAGEDPVGPAVRALRDQSPTLKDFINTIAWMTSFEQLQEAIKK